MNKVLVLGAGMVSRPLVVYLLNQPHCKVVVASRTVSKAEKLIDGHLVGKALEFDIKKHSGSLDELISNSDVVVSLLPYTYHVKVAELCIKNKKHMVTTSYVSPEMQELDDKAKDAGVLILNECGLDPGIDHMSAMKIIHNVEKNEGKVTDFRSTTGALPSHEANNNPFGYKFSWSPRGVLLASRNPAKWLQDNKIVSLSGEKLFENYSLQDVEDIGTFENYPNRDSVQYKEIYKLKDAKTVYRGTFRMPGWCETLKAISEIGWLDDQEQKGFNGRTYGDLTCFLINTKSSDDLAKKTAEYLKIKPYSALIKRLEWLGLFSDKKLPLDKNNPLDYLNVLTLEKMFLKKEERDMIVMHHEFKVENKNNKNEYITSTLLDYGIPNGDSAVARTVALPAAIAVKMILSEKIKLSGVYRPVIPDIYNPILNELEEIGIKFKEKIK